LTSGTGAVLWTYGIYILFTHVWQIPAQCRVYCSIHNCSFFPQKKNCDLHSGLWNLAGPLVSKFFLDVSARQGASFALVLLIALSIVYACFTKVTCSHWFENMQLYFFALRENHEVWTLLSL
jgi:hypothetical protein